MNETANSESLSERRKKGLPGFSLKPPTPINDASHAVSAASTIASAVHGAAPTRGASTTQEANPTDQLFPELAKTRQELDVTKVALAKAEALAEEHQANAIPVLLQHLDAKGSQVAQDKATIQTLQDQVNELLEERSHRKALQAQLLDMEERLSSAKKQAARSATDPSVSKAKLEESLSNVLGMLSDAEAQLAASKTKHQEEKDHLKAQIVGLMANQAKSSTISQPKLIEQLELKVANANSRTERYQKRLSDANARVEELTKTNTELDQQLNELKTAGQAEAEAIIQDANVVTERLLKKLTEAKKDRKGLQGRISELESQLQKLLPAEPQSHVLDESKATSGLLDTPNKFDPSNNTISIGIPGYTTEAPLVLSERRSTKVSERRQFAPEKALSDKAEATPTPGYVALAVDAASKLKEANAEVELLRKKLADANELNDAYYTRVTRLDEHLKSIKTVAVREAGKFWSAKHKALEDALEAESKAHVATRAELSASVSKVVEQRTNLEEEIKKVAALENQLRSVRKFMDDENNIGHTLGPASQRRVVSEFDRIRDAAARELGLFAEARSLDSETVAASGGQSGLLIDEKELQELRLSLVCVEKELQAERSRSKTNQQVFAERIGTLTAERDQFEKELAEHRREAQNGAQEKQRSQAVFRASTLLSAMTAAVGMRFNKDFRQSRGKGVTITYVAENSPAWAAGIRAGHVVERFNGVITDTAPELMLALKDVFPGDHVGVQVDVGFGKVQKFMLYVRCRELDVSFETIVELRRMASGVVIPDDAGILDAVEEAYQHRKASVQMDAHVASASGQLPPRSTPRRKKDTSKEANNYSLELNSDNLTKLKDDNSLAAESTTSVSSPMPQARPGGGARPRLVERNSAEFDAEMSRAAQGGGSDGGHTPNRLQPTRSPGRERTNIFARTPKDSGRGTSSPGLASGPRTPSKGGKSPARRKAGSRGSSGQGGAYPSLVSPRLYPPVSPKLLGQAQVLMMGRSKSAPRAHSLGSTPISGKPEFRVTKYAMPADASGAAAKVGRSPSLTRAQTNALRVSSVEL